MFDMYMDFALKVKEKLMADLNGRIWFDIYPSIDTIIFNVEFKGFKFNYGLNDIQENIIMKSEFATESAEKIKSHYKKSLFNAFFKSEKHKERDNKKKLGLYLEEL